MDTLTEQQAELAADDERIAHEHTISLAHIKALMRGQAVQLLTDHCDEGCLKVLIERAAWGECS